MMDWNLLISGVIGLIAGGGVSWVFRIREDKVKSKTDAMSKMMELITDQQERFNKIIADKDEVIRQQGEIIIGYKASLDEANQKIKAFEYKGAERDRKIEGMQKILSKEVGKKKFAESRICLVEDCKLRQPDKDTFNSDDK